MIGHFRILPFLLGLATALIILSFYKPEKHTINQYPHPGYASDKIFKDRSGTCYKYSSHEVNCDTNEGTLKDYPIQG